MTPGQLAKLIADQVLDRLESVLWAIVLELLQGERDDDRPLSARQCADRWGRTPRWWRDHKAEFGARPSGNGPRPRWEFDPAEVKRVLAERRAG